jgi:hypothetical protein
MKLRPKWFLNTTIALARFIGTKHGKTATDKRPNSRTEVPAYVAVLEALDSNGDRLEGLRESAILVRLLARSHRSLRMMRSSRQVCSRRRYQAKDSINGTGRLCARADQFVHRAALARARYPAARAEAISSPGCPLLSVERFPLALRPTHIGWRTPG